MKKQVNPAGATRRNLTLSKRTISNLDANSILTSDEMNGKGGGKTRGRNLTCQGTVQCTITCVLCTW